MKVVLERGWTKTIKCSACDSYLRIDAGDLRMTMEEDVYFVCEVCDTKHEIGEVEEIDEVPEYVIRKLKKLLQEKQH